MGNGFYSAILAKRYLGQNVSTGSKATSLGVPKGFLAFYVGETLKKRYVVPVSYLNHPTFQDLLREVEQEFALTQPMGGLTIP